MTDNRRMHDRFRLWLPARIEGGDETRLAVGHDMSQKGSLLVTHGALEVGADIELFVRIPPTASEEIKVVATVLRCEPNEADPEGLWPFQIAVEFRDADPSLEALLREQAQHLDGLADSLVDSGEQP